MDTLKVLDELQEMIASVPKNDNATDQIRFCFNQKRKEVKQELEKQQRTNQKNNEE